MIFADTTPNAEDLERFLYVAATYDEPNVIDAMLWAYGVGCIRGSAQGSAFGNAMIAELRKDGAFE